MFSLALCSDILAICCIKKHVCVGIGNSIGVYCLITRKLVVKLTVLENDNIHSIVRGSGGKLIVYGGKSLRVCELEFIDEAVKLHVCSNLLQFADWIIAAEFSQEKENDWLRILFAHNNLVLCDTSKKQIFNVWCQEKCILYGGSLLVKDNRETVVFSGTVFQEILIWQVTNDRKYPEDVPILHRLKGHKGVIFSVVYDATSRLMSSTSDDRTIRLWRVKNKSSVDKNEIDWRDCDVDLTTTMYGHTARVWRSVIKNNRIWSIGEDSLLCTWSFDGQLLNKIEAHHGAEIWSIDVSEDDGKILTGGADGAVNVWDFEPTDSLPVATMVGENNLPGVPKYVCYMNSGTIVVFVDGGSLITYDNDLKETQRLSLSLRYRSYCIMENSRCGRKIALGSKDGYAEIFEEYQESDVWRLRKMMEEKAMESRVLSLHWSTDETILVCGETGVLKIIDIYNREEARKSERSAFVLPASRERWTTAAIAVNDLMLCGDRAGSVYVYNLLGDGNAAAQIFPKIHGRLGVQSLSISGDKVLSTGRDGVLRYYQVRDERHSLRSLHSHKMPMDWVCRTLPYNDDLLVLGFKEVEFVIYSMNLKRIVLRFICGGGHRSWDCRALNGGLVNFLYIKDKQVYEASGRLRDTSRPIRVGLHTKEIYCVEPLVTSSGRNILVTAGEDSVLRVSTIARSQSQVDEANYVSPLATYDGHISNVKSLAILNTEDSDRCTRNLVFSGGGRAQLKVWEICVKFEDKAALDSQNVTCRELLSYMLYGTDKDRKKTSSPSVNAGSLEDPETRFMDINAKISAQDPNRVTLFVGCSDGLVRIFLYDALNNSLRLSHVVKRCSRCTLKVHSFVHNADTILLSMTTDGNVSFWQIKLDIDTLVDGTMDHVKSEHTTASLPFAKIKIHQNGINSFDFRKVDGGSRYLLLTGGDDNLISLVVFEILTTKDGFAAHTVSKWQSSSIHSAQITGAKFVGKNRMLTAGIDQRVVVHSYSLDDKVLSVSQIDEIMTFVPDVQGITLCCSPQVNGETLACVYGKGLEVIVLSKENA